MYGARALLYVEAIVAAGLHLCWNSVNPGVPSAYEQKVPSLKTFT